MPHLPADPDARAALREPTERHPWRVLVSGCMTGTPCGWRGDDNGLSAHGPLQAFLAHPKVTPVPFCPEHLALGTPRGIPDLHGGDGFDVLEGRARVLVDGKEDVTEALVRHATAMAELGETCDLALLLDVSATCGSQVLHLGTRTAPQPRYQAGPGVVAALLWTRRIPFTSQRDPWTLDRLMARVEGRSPAEDAGVDHHHHPWTGANLPDSPWSTQPRALARRPDVSTRQPVFKVLTAAQWASRQGSVPWAPVDEADGFLHLSAADQLERTLALHFAGQTGLVHLRLDPARIPALVWEPSRGGQLFPHAYGATPLSAVVSVEVHDRAPSSREGLPPHTTARRCRSGRPPPPVGCAAAQCR
jgi:uncharacterized protein (DUF952 family)/uncharacterized protein YbbK (DUF523 family)